MKYLLGFVMLLALGRVAAVAAPDQTTTVTLHFPERSMGTLYLLGPEVGKAKETAEPVWRVNYFYSDAGIGMSAKGDIVVPAGWDYSLRLTSSALLESDSPDSPTLAQYAPERLKGLDFDRGELSAKGVARLRAATRLKRLRLTPQTWLAEKEKGAVFAALGQLTSLRELMVYKEDVFSSANLARLGRLPVLERLILAGLKIDAQGFAELAKMPSLRILTVQTGGGCRGIGELGRSSSLRYLTVSGLEVDAQQGLGALGMLKGLFIDVTTGKLTGEGYQALAQLTQLEELTLGARTRVPGAKLDRITGMRSLKNLGLMDVATPEELETIAKMDWLEALTLGTRLQGRGVAAIARLTGLKSLNIRELDCASEELVPLAALQRLEKISIGDGMGEKAIKQIMAIKSLRSIGLWTGLQQHTMMNSATLARLGEMPNLESFGTSYDLGEREVLSIPELPHLKSLALTDLPLTDAGLAHLARFKGLEELRLHGSGLTYERLRDLAAALPRLKKLNLLSVSKMNRDEVFKIAQAIPGFEVRYLMKQ